MSIIALDVGATKIRVGLLRDDYKIIKKQTFATPKKAKEVLNLIDKGIKSFYTPKIKKINLGIAGQIDFKNGIVNFGPNFPKGLKNVPLKKILEKKFKRPVLIDNDAHCFALAEAILGQGKKYNFILGVTLGTGIGGGIVINPPSLKLRGAGKKILRGENNTCGEIGHQVIEINGRKCGCGKRGCFEAYASGLAMVKLYQEITGEKKNVLQIEQDFLSGEKTAKLVVQKTAYYLALGLSDLINILNPEVVILGGGLSKFKEFINLAKKEIKNFLLTSNLQETPIIVTKLNDNGGLLGAALLKN